MIVSFDRILQSFAIFELFGFVGEQRVVIVIFLVIYVVAPILRIIQLLLNLVQHLFDFQADAFAASLGLNVEPALTREALVSRT